MTTTTSISFDLSAGERLIWSGAPRQGIVFRNADIAMVPFSLLWGGFAIFWEVTALRGAPFFFALWGIPFVVIGLYMMVGRFFFDSLRRRGTFYGLTDQRIIVASRLPARAVKSYSLGTLQNLALDDHGNGTGTIQFGPLVTRNSGGRQTMWLSMPTEGAFEMIPDAKRVFDLVREAQLSESRATV
jgi:hypothetical protein